MSRLLFQCQHRYPSGFALDASFEIDDGVSGLFGASGSGKSSILSLITGALRPDRGTVRLLDNTLVDTSAGVCLAAEKRNVGVVFQDHLLFPHFTIEENLRFGQRRRHCRQIDFNRLIELLELAELLRRYPATLSGGQRQRVALGRAILSGPQLLLMDEPFSALDTPLKDRILTYLERAIAEWRLPTLFVSHDQSDVRRLANSVVVLQSGRVVAAGPAAATLDRATMTLLKSHPGPINLLRLDEIRRAEGHWEGRLGQRWIHLPGEMPPENSKLVQFLPSDVTIARGEAPGVSQRNRLDGTVREVIAVNGRAFVAVDIGQFLWSEVTPDSVRELEIAPGMPITCLIKASAIQVIG